MILKNKINLIWYGRGNLTSDSECDAFDLQNTDGSIPLENRPSSLIETVYRVTTNAEGGSGWQEWSSSDFIGQSVVDGPFTKLECGHLYIVIMQGSGENIKQIDIPEAITASDNPTVTINDEALIISPNNEVIDDEDDEVVEPFVCLPGSDTDEWKIFVPGGEETNGMINASTDQTFTFDGLAASLNINWAVAVDKNTEFGDADASEGISFNADLGQNTEIFNIMAKSVDDGVKFRIQIVSWEIITENQNEAQAASAPSPVGCWEGTSSSNVVNLTRVEGSETETVEDGETSDGDNETPDGDNETPVVEDDNTNESTIWADNAECLGFKEDDADDLYRVRYKFSEETVLLTSESNFQITKKTSTGEVELTEGQEYDDIKTLIDNAIEAASASETIYSVDFSFIFSYERADAGSASVLITYPNTTENTADRKINFMGTMQETATMTVTRLNIYDAERELAACAEFGPADQNMFQGASMV